MVKDTVRETIQRTGFFFRALTRRKLDLLDQLESEHVQVEWLFLQWRLATRNARREEIFNSIREKLLLHASLEESVFYPACAEVPELKKMTADAYLEHKKMKALLKEISHLTHANGKFNTKMRKLYAEVRTHVRKEENIFFPRVRELVKSPLLYKLGREYRSTKHDIAPKIAA